MALRERPWAAVAAATAVNLPLGSLYAFSVFLKPMEAMFQASRSDLSLTFALATISFTIGMNLAPRLFAFASAPLLVILCAVSSTLGIALTAAANELAMVVAGYGVLFGLGGGVAYILAQQAVNMTVRRHKGLVNGYIVGLYPLGAMIAAPLFGWAIAGSGLRATLAGLAVTLAVTGLLSAVLLRYAGVRLKPAAEDAHAELSPGRASVFVQMCLVFFLAAAAGLTVLSQAAGIILAYGGTTGLSLGAATAIPGAIACARLGGGWLVDHFAIPSVMALAHGFALAGAVLLTLWPAPLVAAVTLAMIGMGYGFISGSSAAAIAWYWPSRFYGRVASRLYIAWCVAAVSLPVLAGYLFDLTGGYRAVVIIAGCGNLIGITVALALPCQARPALATT